MSRIKKYDHFLILEKFDDNIKLELKRLGVTDETEIEEYLTNSKKGNLSIYLNGHGRVMTFGILKALFLDSQQANRKTKMRVGVVKAVHRILPTAIAPFLPIIAIMGSVLGTTRAFNKVITPILSNPAKDYPEFLTRIIRGMMKVAEGEIPMKDRFSRVFVVSDGIIDVIKEEVLYEFSMFLSDKMSKEDLDKEVPPNYIENELKQYLNDNYDIDPSIPMKEST